MRLGRRRTPVLAEIEDSSRVGAPPGSLQRRDMDAYGGVLRRLGGARTLLVTGDPGGKEKAAVGLAATAAAAATRTVLLECDLAEPRVAETLGLAAAPGLSEYLRGEVEASRTLKAVVLAGPGSAGATEPLVCVVAGRPAREASSLLGSDRLRQSLERLRSSYDLVVIAGPPLRDPQSLAALREQADSAIACVDRSASRRSLPIRVDGLVVRD